jgi:hypothetical protein
MPSISCPSAPKSWSSFLSIRAEACAPSITAAIIACAWAPNAGSVIVLSKPESPNMSPHSDEDDGGSIAGRFVSGGCEPLPNMENLMASSSRR